MVSNPSGKYAIDGGVRGKKIKFGGLTVSERRLRRRSKTAT